jgi:primosomal protein N' (replication factor Y)
VNFGLGTLRVEDELVKKFTGPNKLVLGESLLRCDSDTMRHARDYDSALGRFSAGEIKVLVGTQMIAKGLDFPNVRLVGVVLADTTLGLPDFRAGERTFQLISQVAGRAGRSSLGGRVIVQTLSPQSPAIRYAAAHDYEGFATRELNIRVGAKLPPATRMARIVCRDLVAGKARARAEDLAGLLRGLGLPLRVIGAMETPISRIASHYRFAVEVYAADARELNRGLSAIREQGLLKSDAATAIDVDPLDLL